MGWNHSPASIAVTLGTIATLIVNDLAPNWIANGAFGAMETEWHEGLRGTLLEQSLHRLVTHVW